MKIRPQRPTPPQRPAPLSPDATPAERDAWHAQNQAYIARMRVYETAWARYTEELMASVDEDIPDAATTAAAREAEPPDIDTLVAARQAQLASPAPPVVEAPVTVVPVAPATTLEFEGVQFAVQQTDVVRLQLAVGLANAAIANGIEAGDLRWRHPDRDFTWPSAVGAPVPMDHETLIAFAGAVFDAMDG